MPNAHLARGVAALAVWLLIGGGHAAAEQARAPATNDDCLVCHADPAAARADGRTVAVDPGPFARSVHGPLSCVDCHTSLAATKEFPHPDRLPRAACATCHADAGAAYDQSAHARSRRESDRSQAARCADCHGTHDIRPSSDPESRTAHFNVPATCGRCHGDPKLVAKAGIAAGDVFHQYEDSIHGRGVGKSGLTVAPTCATCHGGHEVRDRHDPKSRVYKANQATTCGTCHEGVKTSFGRGIHGRALARGNAQAPACADCHTAHRIQRADVPAWRLDVVRECGTCHRESIQTYRDGFHGQVTNLGFVRVATCADCHGPHEILPKADPRSSVSRTRVVQTCARCHPGANANFAGYDPHADPIDRARSPVIYYTALLMNVLLYGVFGFFGLHTAVWLTRGLVDRSACHGDRSKAERQP